MAATGHQSADLFELGNALVERGEAHAAIDAFRRCLALAPHQADASYNLGNALRQDGNPVEAVEAFVHCLRLRPDFGPAYINLADTLRTLGLTEQARMMAEQGVHYLPDEPGAKICLAGVLHDCAEYAAAAALYTDALAHSPDHAGAWSSLGNTLHAMGCFPAALAAHDRAVAASPRQAEFHFNRSVTQLADGDFLRGWDEYEWRWRCPQNRSRLFGEPWRGEDIAGQTILLHAEQGLGDTLQFVRYVPMVAALGCRVLLEVQPSLVRLLRDFPAQVLARGEELPRFDANCPLLSLPRAFATTLETIPATLPYLRADELAASRSKAKLPMGGGLRVGLVWSGSAHEDDAGFHKIDRRRSIPLAEFATLGDVAAVHLISLQQHAPKQDRPGLTLIDPMADVADFADTAALVANLDLVISVDTSVAHLAGGMGRPVWLLSRYDGCWRWLHDRTDSPWYPGMRIYRQEQPHDWPAVIARVRHDLAVLARHHQATGATS